MDINKERHPRSLAGILSRLFFCWTINILRIGNRRPLNKDDLFPLCEKDEAQSIVEELEDLWKDEIQRAGKNGVKPRLWKAMLRFIPVGKCLSIFTLRLLESFSMFATAVLLWVYLNLSYEGPRHHMSHLVAVVVGISLCSLLKTFTLHHNNMNGLEMGMRLKIACIGITYKKILGCTRRSLSKVTAGHIINLVSNDAQRLEKLILLVVFFTAIIIDLPISIALLWSLVGWQSLTGVAVIILFYFVQFYVSKKFAKLRMNQAAVTDRRLTTLNDIIRGIRAVKMYAWEWNYRDIVKTLRRKEVKLIYFKSLILTIVDTLYLTLPIVAGMAAVVTLILSGVHLSAVNTFTILSILNILADSTFRQMKGVREVYDGMVSIKRIEAFLLTVDYKMSEIIEQKDNEKSSKSVSTLRKVFGKKPLHKDGGNYSKFKYSLLHNTEEGVESLEEVTLDVREPYVTLIQASSGWLDEANQCTLHDISLNTKANELLMVTGPVGSGKSSLLMTILGEISLKSGDISTHGKIAYVSQVPWIFTGTVRENILFGRELNEKQYQRVLEVCDLQKDMDRFPKGDLSMIGQRGVSLSGGQRARVSLARAVYSDADIYLLDDPLSAIDAKVGQHIFDMCICGELSRRIRVLVTHQLQHLHRADSIVVLHEGCIVRQGSYERLNDDAGYITDMLKDYRKTIPSEDLAADTPDNLDSCAGRDMIEAEEERAVGVVSWGLYWDYLRSGLPTVAVVGLLLYMIVAHGMLLVPNVWLKAMSKMSYSDQRNPVTLGVYGGVTAASMVVEAIGIFCLYFTFVKSSEKLHDKLTCAVITSPVLFFDTNPVGRIMNLFAKDIGSMDDLLPINSVESLTPFLFCLAVMVLTAIINYWLVLVVVPAMVLFTAICRYYLKTSRELSRIEAIQCSSVYAHFSETMTGLEVIHSLQMKKRSMEKYYDIQNTHTRVFSLMVSTSRCLCLYLDLLSAVFITAVAFGTLFLSMDSASTGLLLTYAISLLRQTSLSIRLGSDVENLMVSVERVQKYSQIPSEPGYSRPTQPPEDWPHAGALSLRGISMVYLEGGTCVLEDISFDVKPREKVGIAGRTGAGKSSLVAALFRMPDPKGQVLIDGVDLGTINVQAARRSMAVVTQDPVLFAGTLKMNLDPFNLFSKEEIWRVLEEVQLQDRVNRLEGLLEYSFGEGGSGFSAGERQLLCLARALLQRCKILVLDEATANVDYKTDQLIQQVIRQKFTNCTVLTIAHRLDTIMDYDKVVVLDQGHVVEYDSPSVLASKSNGVFASQLQTHESSSM